MIKITCSPADIEALQYGRFQHPDPRVHVRMEALYLRSQRVASHEISRLCDLSNASFHRHLKAYVRGGIEPLKHIEPYRPQRELATHRPGHEAHVQQHPPTTVADAAAKIAELSGTGSQPAQVRQFLHALGMKPRQVGMIPANVELTQLMDLRENKGQLKNEES